MAKAALPTPELLRKLLRYEPKTGDLFWLERSGDLFEDGKGNSAAQVAKNFNSNFAGKKALSSQNPEGYLAGCVQGKYLKAHRVAWAIHFGEWPTGHIDHINGIRNDNRIQNLRDVSPRQNSWNRSAEVGSSSKHRGVYKARSGRWVCQITAHGTANYLGTFDTEEEAAQVARVFYEQQFGAFQRQSGDNR